MALQIRDAAIADRPAIISITERSGGLFTEEERGCARELFDIYLKEKNGDYIFVIAVGADGLTVGYLCYGRAAFAQGVYDIYWIVVDPEARGNGVGRSLIEHIESLLKKLGARLMVAETSGIASYEGTRGFYRRCGFREEARIRDFFRPGDDKIIYVKDIS